MVVVARQESLFCLVFWLATCLETGGFSAAWAVLDEQQMTQTRPGRRRQARPARTQPRTTRHSRWRWGAARIDARRANSFKSTVGDRRLDHEPRPLKGVVADFVPVPLEQFVFLAPGSPEHVQ